MAIDWGRYSMPYARLHLWSIWHLYIGIVLDLAVGVVVCKTCMLEWLGVHLPSIYMHCPRSISGFSGMQGIYAWLTGKGHMKCNGIQGIYASIDWVVHLPSIYMHCPRSSNGCSGMQGICAWLTGRAYIYMKCSGIQGIYARIDWGSICLLYIYALS